MWKDSADTIEAIFDCIMERKAGGVPLICPVCEKEHAHYYFHKWNEKSNSGGMWIWCSNCKSFSHSTVKVPEWWKNCNEIAIEKLNSIPDYLEENKEKVDNFVNELCSENS
ncbi:hypothetical protein [Paenibacillus aceris]|uniref:Uncharacterized protein n=1 Tax=Paenibacillus aceris TaxID=869555 RepID=A0ABS4I9G4_9BACL|nr:hypothetical protein [Paenibacillus aceris]MBP1967572.1 hypothetical protein [Paenibacillus aceris]NHW37564.1 hypothetical protein [Paenibacillus aceris]